MAKTEPVDQEQPAPAEAAGSETAEAASRALVGKVPLVPEIVLAA